MPDVNPRTQQARVTSKLYHVGNPLVVGTESSYDIRDTATKTFMLPLAKSGVVDMGLTFNHSFTRVLGTGLALSASGDTVTKAGHGLANGRTVTLANIVSATGVATATTYFVVNATTNTFQLSTAVSGTAVDITADGTADVLVDILCLVQLFNGWDTSEIGGSASGTGVQLWPVVFDATQDAPSGCRWHFLPEVSTSVGNAHRTNRAFEITEFRAPLQSVKLTVNAREVPDAGTLIFRLVQRY